MHHNSIELVTDASDSDIVQDLNEIVQINLEKTTQIDSKKSIQELFIRKNNSL